MLSEKLVNEMISYCGLVCSTCPIHLATLEANREEQVKKRIEIARLCKEEYGMKYESRDITDCDGCRVEDGRLFSGCVDCGIRACARRRKIENCAQCVDYSCKKLETFFIRDPSARMRLEGLKRLT